MSQSSRSHHRTPSVRALAMSSNFTNVRPLIIWQTKGQREQHDLAGLTGIGEGKRGSGREDGEERRRRVSKTRVKYQQTSPIGIPRYRSWREESPAPRPRGKSCSRIRSYSRGRSRSPRRAGEPGPGILKGRSATHDGRKREGSMVGWKMLRINRVDEVREFSPWSEDEQQGDDPEIGVEEEVTSRQELKIQSAKHKLDNTKMADDDKKAHDDVKIDKNECSVQITITPTRRVAKIIKRKKVIKPVPVVVAVREKLEKTEQGDREDIVKDSDSDEITTTDMELDGNNNGLSEVEVQDDDIEESFYGFDPLLERDPQLPVAAGYEALIDQLESEGPRQAGMLEVKFSGDYESRPVQCVHKDCQATSLPSTLELLPLPRSGYQWLCSAHSECLLCPEPSSLSTCVRCTMCARLYHTTHLDMEEFQDKLERELFICKLCSDPSQFIQQGEEQREEVTSKAVPRVFSPLPRQMLPSNLQPSPAPMYTKIKPRPPTTTQACPKQRSVVTSRGKPLQHTDPSLPPGWHRELVKSSDSRWRVVIIGPDGRRFWSKNDIKKAFSGQGMGGIKWEEFNFSVFGPK